MATKTITITVDAYERLASLKASNESFSDVINKLTVKHSLSELIGILSEKQADALEASIRETRKRVRESVEKTAAELR